MISDRSVCVILPAAGSGSRFGSETNKLFAPLLGQPLWTHAAQTLLSSPLVGRIVLAVSEVDRKRFDKEIATLNLPKPIDVILGGEQRTDSVFAALQHCARLAPETLIAIHDAARPCLRSSDLENVLQAAHRTGAAMLATPMTGTVKRCDADSDSMTTRGTVDRNGLFIAMTPQVFRHDILLAAVTRHRGRPATDDAELVERSGRAVTLVIGSSDNIKVTFPEDLTIATAILQCSGDKPGPSC